TYFLEGNLSQAIEYYRQGLSVDPNDTNAYIELAKALMRTKDFAGAHSALDSALASNPDSKQALLGMADLEEQSGNSNRAEIILRKLNRSNPLDVDILESLADCLDGQNKSEESIALYQRIVQLKP